MRLFVPLCGEMGINARLISAACLLCLITACSDKPTPTSPTNQPIPETRIIALSGDLAFGNVELGRPATSTLTITNNGNAALIITGATITMSGSASPSEARFIAASGIEAIPANESRSRSVYFTPMALGRYDGVLTVTGNQTAGTNTTAISGSGVFSGGPMFIVTSICPRPVTAGTSAALACAVLVNENGMTTVGMKVTVDLSAFGKSQAVQLGECWGCGQIEYDLDLKIPADMPAGNVPITFTVTDIGGRAQTTTANLQVVG